MKIKIYIYTFLESLDQYESGNVLRILILTKHRNVKEGGGGGFRKLFFNGRVGLRSEEKMSRVHQDDDFIYPSLDVSDDEDISIEPKVGGYVRTIKRIRYGSGLHIKNLLKL